MGNKRDITVAVRGIRYEEFAGVKWRQFLRGFSLAVAALALAAVMMYHNGRLPSQIPVPVALAVLLAAAGSLAIYRAVIRREYRASGLGNMALQYQFDRDGWTVRQGTTQVRTLWSHTWRVRRDQRALMLYPSRRSVNLVPLRDLSPQQADQIIAWVQGKRKSAEKS